MKLFSPILILVLSSFMSPLFSQDGMGELEISQDARIDSLLRFHVRLNEERLTNPDNYGIEGYRVQIFFESGNYSGARAREVKEVFELDYPEIPAYITWQSPNYRVRVGDFRTRMDAQRFLQQIIRDYPNAWVIKDEIKFPSLN
ncbi:MAG: SPOR domain-containing protein [Bacteroidetes bacterium]|nr:SPOR domain-containing protein [Bacteroidota bacterium]